MTEILALLRDRGILLGMITNGYAPMWMRDFELAHYGLLEYFTTCRFSSADEGVLKPHPDLFTKALDCLGTTAQETVFVGDSLSADVAGAQGVGMRAVHRARTSSEAYYEPVIDIRPDATIEDLRELCVEADVKMVACQMTVDLFDMNPSDFIDGVEFGGAATFFEFAGEADICLYI